MVRRVRRVGRCERPGLCILNRQPVKTIHHKFSIHKNSLTVFDRQRREMGGYINILHRDGTGPGVVRHCSASRYANSRQPIHHIPPALEQRAKTPRHASSTRIHVARIVVFRNSVSCVLFDLVSVSHHLRLEWTNRELKIHEAGCSGSGSGSGSVDTINVVQWVLKW